jgi:hypothetical protein
MCIAEQRVMRLLESLGSLAAVFALTGCGDGPEPAVHASSAVGADGTVQDAANAAGCSTFVVHGLSQQIVDEINCLIPNALAPLPDEPNVVKSDTTFAFLQPPARDALVSALASRPGTTMNVDSMLRTVAQQYLLYAWYKGGDCGIQLAATPGSSNHEQGLAFDTPDYDTWKDTLNNGGFRWFGSSDVVHFDYVGGGAVDLNSKDVLAFQKLWNINNPSDTISEDGQYGPGTEARLQESPADGFPQGASCGSQPGPDASDDAGSDDAGRDAPAGTCELAGNSYVTSTCTETQQCDNGSWVSRTSDSTSCNTGVEPNGACITDTGTVVPENTCTSTLQCQNGVWVNRNGDPAACL